MEYLAKPVQEEYKRWCEKLGNEDPYQGQSTVGLFDALRAHFLIADYFYEEGGGIGGIGPRDIDLLHSALYRQFIGYGGRSKWKDDIEVCATLMYGLIKDHPFYDANKRTAFLVALFHLQKIGRWITASQKKFEDFTVEIAEGRLAKYPRYENLKKKKKDELEVSFIADFLRRNTRQINRKYYAVTYSELNTLLHKFGFELVNPRHNHIDIVRVEERRKIFGVLGKKEKVGNRVGQIGFPAWKSKVGKGAIKTVREVTKLNPKNGIDSDSFYYGTDPMQSLIDIYHSPLKRLADR